MNKNLMKYLSIPLISMIIGCSTTTSILKKSKLNSPVKITLDSKIIDSFRKKEYKKAGKLLENIIEKDMSRLFNLDIDFAPISYGNTGHFLIVTKKGSLNIIYSKRFHLYELDDKEKIKLKKLAEIYGPNLSNTIITDNFELNRNLEDKEKNYSALVCGSGGYALNLLFGHYIRVNPKTNLNGLVDSISHEITHTLIFNKSSPKYLFKHLLSYLDWIDGDELMAINETACNIIANRVNIYFKENHLIKNSNLYNNYEENEKFYERISKELEKIVKEYKAIPKDERIVNRSEIFKKFENNIKTKFNLKEFKLNEAKLSLYRRYSGDEEVNNKLNFLYDNLGPKKFIRLIPDLYNLEDLRKVYEEVRSGK